MDQQKEFKNEGHPEGCRCMMCHGRGMMCGNGMQSGCHGRKFCFLRLVLFIIIISFVFSAGFKLGELKSDLKNELYGSNGRISRYMMIRDNNGSAYYGPQMMSGWYAQQATTTAK